MPRAPKSPASRASRPASKRPAAIVLLTLLLGCDGAEPAREDSPSAVGKPNVLFLIVDDLLPLLGCYGATEMHTPSIARLAASGVVFTRAYCQVALCSPSRASVLSGTRPATNGVYDLKTRYRKALPDAVVLPELFRDHGYVALAAGKVHHGRGQMDDRRAWSERPWRPDDWQLTYAAPESFAEMERLRSLFAPELEHPPSRPYFATEAPEVADSALPDGAIADEAIRRLRELAPREEPFFLAVGFLKPHLPFVAPRRYWDLYPETQLPEIVDPEPPRGAPAVALPRELETTKFIDLHRDGEFDQDEQRRLLRGYRAAVSYADAQVGRVLDALAELDVADDTIVVLWGDHGWHLGELGTWGKMTNYEAATRVPLVVRAPGRGEAGARSDALVELVDLFPTLAELCGLPLPPQLEGTSLVPLLDEPEQDFKSAVFSELLRQDSEEGDSLGRSVRTERYRLTEWSHAERGVFAVELYDYEQDRSERVNLAPLGAHDARVAELSGQLEAGWRAALPPR